MHEMVSDGSLRAEDWTGSRKISMRVLFASEKMEKTQYGRNEHTQIVFRGKKLSSYTGHTKIRKKPIYPI